MKCGAKWPEHTASGSSTASRAPVPSSAALAETEDRQRNPPGVFNRLAFGLSNPWQWYRGRRWWWQAAIGVGVVLVGLTAISAILPKKHGQTNAGPTVTQEQAQALAAAATARAATPSPTLTAEQIVYAQAVATSANQARLDREATIAAQPTRTPIPPPYEVASLTASCTHEFGYDTCEGSVKNLTSAPLMHVEAVVEYATDHNAPTVSSGEALIDYDPLLPGQESPWKVIVRYNPALVAARVQFKLLLGGTLFTEYCWGGAPGPTC